MVRDPDRMPAAPLLVDAATLAAHLDDPDWVVVDCCFDLMVPAAGYRQYREGHIPGARYAHLDDDLAARPQPHQGRHPLPTPAVFAARLGSWGVHDGARIVAYDQGSGALAARLWWMARWLGHDRVSVLDGGRRAWLAHGGPLQVERSTWRAAEFVPREVRDHWVVETQSLVELLDGGGLVLLDARAAERYRGEEENIDPVAGHVPGALSFPFSKNLAEDGRFLSGAEIKARFQAELSGQPAEAAVAMCGSGVTACHLLLALNLAGLGDGRLYAGSWSEWIRDPRRPVALGPTP